MTRAGDRVSARLLGLSLRAVLLAAGAAHAEDLNGADLTAPPKAAGGTARRRVTGTLAA